MTPKGKMIIIGGGVDKGSFTEQEFTDQVENNLNFFEKGILRRLLDESAQGPNSRIEIVPTASKIPKIVGDEYAKAFRFLGAENVGVLNIVNRTECENPGVLERVRKAGIVFFTGGDQLRLTSIIGGTSLHEILLQKYMNEPFVYAGTSAGAACVSKQMIYQGSSSEALQKGEIKITSGLGFIDNVTIDTHFVKRGRIGRLFQAVVSNPKTLGLGLGEDTGLLIKNGHTMEAIGSGLVILVDGRKITDTNITDISMGDPISINNLIVHVMSKGDVYQLNNHSFTIFKNANLSA
ncbi:MAG: cyanophycinase [Crocinitomicaceae bacterium]